MLSDVEVNYKTFSAFLKAFFKWTMVALIVGLLGGLVGLAFHLSVEYVTELRMAHKWLLFAAPVCGLVIVSLYKLSKTEGKGTNSIIKNVTFGSEVPLLLVPVIFASTVLTHLCGGSVGREGAALQIGGSIGCNTGKLLHLSEKEAPLATLCGMSALFSALFGTPLGATVFALEVCSVGIFYYSGLLPCILAAITAYGVTTLFGIAPTRFAVTAYALSPVGFIKVAALAAVCALMSVLFCEALHHGEHFAEKHIKNSYLRILAGSALLIVLTLLCGSMDYNGAGMGLISRAIEEGSARPEAFIMKMIFTVLTLSSGFKGGEVVPSFFIGAALGCAAGPLLGLPAGFAAAVGMISMFCGAVNCPLASTFLAVELFGGVSVPYFAAACFISYMLSGYTSLYSAQKIMYSKLRAEYININAR